VSTNEQEIPVKVVDRRWWARGDDGGATAAAERSAKPTYVEELERQLAEKDKTAQEYIAKYRQAASEFDEARLRLRREIAKDIERARREVISELLEVLDNLDRALDAAEDNDLPAQLDLERKLQREAGTHPNYAEGVKAFLGKRKPAFSGKR